MRKVKILDWDKTKIEDGRYTKKEIGEGLFHGWGCDYEEFESGPGNFATAIIEKFDGEVLNHPVELIRFTGDV